MKERFFTRVVAHRRSIIIIFLVFAVIGVFCKSFVAVNYDMNDYLPADAASTAALDLMKEEFKSDIPNARVMVEHVTIPEALAYKAKIEAIKGVTSVVWLDDVADITEPLENQNKDRVETYYKDNAALFTVTIAEDHRITAVSKIRALIGDDNAMTGTAVSIAAATQSTVKEIGKIAVIVVIFVLLILVLTTTSWLEPFLILAGLGIAVIINAGTNLIFGEISFVTNAAGNILQLAISLDFSVFLLHRFRECRGTGENGAADMVQALSKAGTAILSSALTVMIGFLALTVMRFQIGPDLGLALAKGIAISLITVFTFTPALLVTFSKYSDRLRHRPLLPDFHRFSNMVCKFMVPLVFLFAVLPIPCFLAAMSNDYYYGASHIFGANTQVGDDTEAIETIFGKNDTYVLMVPKGDFATETKLSDALKGLPQVNNIVSYVDKAGAEVPTKYIDEGDLLKLISPHYSRMILSVDAAYEGDATFSLVQKIRGIVEEHYPGSWYLAGEGVSTDDLKATVTADTLKVDLIAVGAVFVVLLFAMQSFSLPVLLVLCIETAIWFNLAIPYFNGKPVFYIAYLIIDVIQLGATVDYAILFTDRYKELRKTTPRKPAVMETVAATIVPILTSGSALTVCGFMLGLITSHGVLSQLGFFLGKGTLLSLAAVLFVLPGLLYLFDGLIQKTTRHADFYNEKATSKGGSYQ